MLLADKNAVIYGAAGAIGATVARAFAAEGATVFLTGRNAAALDTVAKEITESGGTVHTAVVDATDEDAVENHVGSVVAQAGSLNISFNAIAVPQQGIQGTPLAELTLERFALPVQTYMTSHFLTTRAAARRMIPQRSGVILTLTATPARLAAPLTGGMAPAWAGIEALTGVTREQFTAMMVGLTHRKRFPALAEVASAAVFAASDHAAAITGTVLNLSGGSITD